MPRGRHAPRSRRHAAALPGSPGCWTGTPQRFPAGNCGAWPWAAPSLPAPTCWSSTSRSASLDTAGAAQLTDAIRGLRAGGTAVVLLSQSADALARAADTGSSSTPAGNGSGTARGGSGFSPAWPPRGRRGACSGCRFRRPGSLGRRPLSGSRPAAGDQRPGFSCPRPGRRRAGGAPARPGSAWCARGRPWPLPVPTVRANPPCCATSTACCGPLAGDVRIRGNTSRAEPAGLVRLRGPAVPAPA